MPALPPSIRNRATSVYSTLLIYTLLSSSFVSDNFNNLDARRSRTKGWGGGGQFPPLQIFFLLTQLGLFFFFPPSLNNILHFITVVWIVLILDILPHILLLRSPVPLLDGYRVPVLLLDGYRVPVPLLDGYRVGSVTGWL